MVPRKNLQVRASPSQRGVPLSTPAPPTPPTPRPAATPTPLRVAQAQGFRLRPSAPSEPPDPGAGGPKTAI